LPSGFATWLNPCLIFVCVCRDNVLIKMKIKIIWIKLFKKIILCSLEHFINL
jgi:hypothetical protein